MPETPDETAELRQEVAELKDTVRVLTDAVDELREELQWLTRNGLPSQQASRRVPVLKQMAANPTADDWSEHLVIARGESDRGSDQPEQSASSGPADHPPPGNPDGSDTLF